MSKRLIFGQSYLKFPVAMAAQKSRYQNFHEGYTAPSPDTYVSPSAFDDM